jgi:ubiquinone/menaquinone biosynthesis C-methylase UbiE
MFASLARSMEARASGGPGDAMADAASSASVDVPAYLARTYWWAYVHPRAVALFERQWLVNLILWGNFARLRDAALDALGADYTGRTLQIACVYGDLTHRLATRVAGHGTLDVVDVLPIQLRNLARKLPRTLPIGLIHANSAALGLPSASYDRALLFFLLHEQPQDVRRATIAEALRVVRPGGRIVIVDYHRPRPTHPLYWPMVAILRTLEPYALNLWEEEITAWFPHGAAGIDVRKATWTGGLYQMLCVTRTVAA